MSYLKINSQLVNYEIAEQLMGICPFNAITYKNGKLDIGSGCKMCKMCVKKGPKGVIEFVEDAGIAINKDEWVGIAVFADYTVDGLHNVTLELIGKAKELAKVTGHPVYALLIGDNTEKTAQKLLKYGVDKVFVYDYPQLHDFKIDIYTNVFEDFINKIKPSSILVGATNLGRSLAPRVAARFRTGLTADCTILEMKENTDLVQIRPAFGGNIMAQIINPNNRPQFCTARYKIFSAPSPVENPTGEKVMMEIDEKRLESVIEIVDVKEKKKEIDISEAEVIVAVGRGIKTKADMCMIEQLADLLSARIACTRPLVEGCWFDAKHQIGLSGRTVKAKLIFAIGISGAVQFAAGMNNSDCIIAINNDKHASIFDIAHYGIVGDLYEIVPKLIEKIKESNANV